MGAVAPNAGASLGERLSIRMDFLAGVWGRKPLGGGMGAVAPNEGASLGERLSIRMALLRLSLDSAWWIRATVRFRHAALLRQLTRLSVSVSVV